MIRLYCPYDKAKIKHFNLLGGKFNKIEKCWMFPNYLESEIQKIKFPENQQHNVITTFENKDTSLYTIKDEDFKLKPFHHQDIALLNSLTYKGYALFCETGTGKTKIALDNAVIRYNHSVIKKVLVVCPKSAVGVWENEIKANTNFNYEVIKGGTISRAEVLKNFAGSSALFSIINYESLFTVQRKKIFVEDSQEKFEDTLKKTVNKNWMVILDESTWIKNPRRTKSKRTKVSQDIAKLAGYRMILTGMPILNNIMDIFSQWFVVDLGEALGFSWYKFREYFFVPQYMKYEWIPKPELYLYIEKMLEEGSIRFLKKDCLDLPEKIYEQRYMEMNEQHKYLYKTMVEDLLIYFEQNEITANTVLSQMMKLQQLANGFIYGQKGGERISLRINRDKINTVMEIIEENPKSKIVIWTNFREDSYSLLAELRKKKLNAHELSSENSAQLVEVFQNVPENEQMILVSNPKSCGYSITLTNADIVIYFSNSFDAGERYQSEDRFHRIGLKKSIVYIDLITKDTIQERIYDSLRQKRNLMDEVLDIKSFLKEGK